MDASDSNADADPNAGAGAEPSSTDGRAAPADPTHEGTETRHYRSDATMLEVVPAETRGRIVHEVHAVEARCPYEAFLDVYEVTVDYRPAARAVEIASLRRYADQFAGVEISHEAFCETVAADLDARLAPRALTVTARCNRYHGIETTVERSLGAASE